jgi:hypothetical protein
MGNTVVGAADVGRVPLPDFDSSDPSDSPTVWSSADARGATSATLQLTWRDQGWGNRRGTLHARKAGEKGWVELTAEPAPHTSARLVICLPAKLLGDGAVELGCTVGGGGGHQLIVTDASVLIRTGEDSGQGASAPLLGASDAKFTIDPGDETCAALLDSPYGRDEGKYREIFEKQRLCSRALVTVLIEEFSRLLHFSDLASVRKAAAIKYLCHDFVESDTVVDLAELRDQRTYLDETVLLVMRLFGEEKHSSYANFDTASILDQDLVQKILSRPTGAERKELTLSQARQGSFPRQTRGFELLVAQIQRETGVMPVEFSGMVYKPIQSLFNKVYVRRGQTATNLIGDLQRGTLLVETPEELDAVKQYLHRECKSNLERNVDVIGSFAGMLTQIDACTALRLDTDGEAIRIIVYRVKDNSSQSERTERGELSHLVNVNFFIDGPQADCSRTSALLGACELQVGVRTTVQALRTAHMPYERQRILDGLPQLQHVIDADTSPAPALAAADGFVDRINTRFATYHCVPTSRRFTLTHRDGHCNYDFLKNREERSYDATGYLPGFEPRLHCLNHSRLNQWARSGTTIMADGYTVAMNRMTLWECDVDPKHAYVCEELKVAIQDQGWGAVGVNIAFFAIVGSYMLEIASRALQECERQLPTLDLIKDSFNFSRFMFSSYLPTGTRRVALVAMGRLSDLGHTFHYSGHSLQLSVVAS